MFVYVRGCIAENELSFVSFKNVFNEVNFSSSLYDIVSSVYFIFHSS